MQEQGDPTRMVMSVLEAHVDPEHWARLEQEFGILERGSPMVIESRLAQNTSQPTLWQIVTIWRNHQAFAQYRAGGPMFQAILFQQLGAEPRLSVFEIARPRA